jgi:hypothetical protein
VVKDVEGGVLVDVGSETLRHAQEAPEAMRDLAVVACFYEVLLERGEEPEEAVLALAATQLVVTILPSMRVIVDAPWDQGEYSRLEARLNYVHKFVRDTRVRAKGTRKIADRLARAAAAAAMAYRGDVAARARLFQQLSPLGNWSMSRSKWPPI